MRRGVLEKESGVAIGCNMVPDSRQRSELAMRRSPEVQGHGIVSLSAPQLSARKKRKR